MSRYYRIVLVLVQVFFGGDLLASDVLHPSGSAKTLYSQSEISRALNAALDVAGAHSPAVHRVALTLGKPIITAGSKRTPILVADADRPVSVEALALGVVVGPEDRTSKVAITLAEYGRISKLPLTIPGRIVVVSKLTQGMQLRPGSTVGWVLSPRDTRIALDPELLVMRLSDRSVVRHGNGSLTVRSESVQKSALDDISRVYVHSGSPWVEEIDPPDAPVSGDTEVLIYGWFLQDATVHFGSFPGEVLENDDSMVRVRTPAHPEGETTLTVTTPYGSESHPFEYTVTPYVNSFTPRGTPVNTTVEVTLHGVLLDLVDAIEFGGTTISSLEFTLHNTDELRFMSPPLASTGGVSLRFRFPEGEKTVRRFFVIFPPAPHIDLIDPDVAPTGGGSLHVIHGDFFDQFSVPSVNGVFPERWLFVSSSEFRFIASPAETAGPATVELTTQSGSASSTLNYVAGPEVTAPQAEVTSIVPDSGPASGGTEVFVHGTNFLPGALITIDGLFVPTEWIDSSTLRLVTPRGLGPAPMFVINGDLMPALMDYTSFYYHATPLVDAIEPDMGPATGGTLVRFWGRNFDFVTDVTFAGVQANIVNFGPGYFEVITPENPEGIAVVQVWSSADGGISTTTFTYVSPNPILDLGSSMLTIRLGESAEIGAFIDTIRASETPVTITCDPDLLVCPASITITPGTQSAFFAVRPVAVGSHAVTGSLPAELGGSTSNAVVEVMPLHLTLQPESIAMNHGATEQMTATISVPQLSVTPVILTCDSSAITCPASVTIPAGHQQVSFTVEALSPGVHSISAALPPETGGMTSIASVEVHAGIAPTVTAVSPARGPVGGGTVVELTGSGFAPDAVVTFGGMPAAATVENGTLITAISPQNPSGGAVDVEVVNGDGKRGTLFSGFLYEFLAATPEGGVAVVLGPVDATFANVISGGITTATPIDPAGVGEVPSGYLLDSIGLAYEISTTAAYDGEIVLGFEIPEWVDEATFYSIRVLHSADGGPLVDETYVSPEGCTPSTDPLQPCPAPNWEARTVYAKVTSLSPFYLATVTQPTMLNVEVPLDPQRVNASVLIQAHYADATGLPGTFLIDWSDGTESEVEASRSDGFGEAVLVHTYQSAGVYQIAVRAVNANGTSSPLRRYIVVYDPSGSFVTGGGWMESPAGALAESPTLAGRATFGFVARYRKGSTTPEGRTQFQFRSGNFNFDSTSYDWLVVSGARAQFKGEGEVNGIAGYSFLLTAVDGERNGGGGRDRFRIKITHRSSGRVVYDNQLGDPEGAEPSVLGGGSIVIHSP